MANTSKRDQDKPAGIALNLDALERENDPGPFAVVFGGKRYELVDANDLDFRVLFETQRAASAGRPEAAVTGLVPKDQREEFFANDLPNWKLEQLFRAYNKHFGLPTPGEASALHSS